MSIPRVRYVERQVLHASDLSDEQAYRIALRRRHNIAGHWWGIAYGLALSPDLDGVQVQPGLAVDGFGRELILAQRLTLSWNSWGDGGNQNLFDLLYGPWQGTARGVDVWLLYVRSTDSAPLRGRRDCTPGQFTRWVESTCLRLLPVADIQVGVDARAPDVPETDLDFGPQDDPPDEPEREWPVYLGRVVQTPNTDTQIPSPFTYNYKAHDRAYVELVGAELTAVSGLAQMQLTDDSNRTRFAVTLPDSNGVLADDRLAATSDGDIAVWGQTNMLADPAQKKAGDFTLANRDVVSEEDILDPLGLLERLVSPSDEVTQQLWAKFDPDTQMQLIGLAQAGGPATPELKQTLARALSQSVQKVSLPAPAPKLARRIAPGTRRLIAQNLSAQKSTGAPDTTLNRLLLQNAFPGAFSFSDTTQDVWGAEFHPLATVPAAAAPWQVYHVVVPQDTGKPRDQLRVEIAHPNDKGNPQLFRLRIGVFRKIPAAPAAPGPMAAAPDKYGWMDCLQVLSDGTVIVGNIHVDGEITQGPIQVDPNDPRFGAALIQEASRGVATSTELDLLIAPVLNGGTVNYTYTVKNKSSFKLTLGPIYENLSMNNKTIRQGAVGAVFTLDPQGSATDTKEIQAPAITPGHGELIIAAVVVAADQSNSVTQKQTSTSIMV